MENNYIIIIKELTFSWDQNKNAMNKIKHGIDSFEAATVFHDDNAILIPDPNHSQYEERFIILGMSALAKLLVVVHCVRENDSEVRIISARNATKSETKDYTFSE